jgi:hypothetical protein
MGQRLTVEGKRRLSGLATLHANRGKTHAHKCITIGCHSVVVGGLKVGLSMMLEMLGDACVYFQSLNVEGEKVGEQGGEVCQALPSVP